MHRADNSSTFLRRQLSYWPYRRIIFNWKIESAVFMNEWFSYFILFFPPKYLTSSSRRFFANSRHPPQTRATLSTELSTTLGLQDFLPTAVWPVIWVQCPVLGQFYHHKFPLSGQVIDELSPAGWPGWEETHTGHTWAAPQAPGKKSADTRACACVLIYSP